MLPEITLSAGQAQAISAFHAMPDDLHGVEESVLASGGLLDRLRRSDDVSSLTRHAATLWRDHDHLIVRGLLADGAGVSALLFAALLFKRFRTYRGRQIVKHFRMSPWTRALSHTLADGHFHTDINTATCPPSATVIQCIEPDPSGPAFGQLRVARAEAIIEELRRMDDTRTQEFLTEDQVVMVNDSSPDAWSGRIVDGSTTRFHPETLRAARRRYGTNPPDLDERVAAVHAAALAVSSPIALDRGDTLILSNHRALHYRSACTVRFRTFPRDFEARAVAVFHTLDEPS